MNHPQFRVASKHETVDTEKCPRCLDVFQHFMEVTHGLLACYKCGSVFISKPVRDYNYSRIMEQQKEQQLEVQDLEKLRAHKCKCDQETLVDPITGPPEVIKESETIRFLCSYPECRFEAKSKAGLVAHQRRCKNK